jgi:hypothetical protein
VVQLLLGFGAIHVWDIVFLVVRMFGMSIEDIVKVSNRAVTWLFIFAVLVVIVLRHRRISGVGPRDITNSLGGFEGVQ